MATSGVPISDADARLLDRGDAPALPEVSDGWDPGDVAWEWHDGEYSGLVPVGWQAWTSWEDVPVDVWEDQASDAGFRVTLLGCNLFLAVIVHYADGDTEVDLYPPRDEDSVTAWEFMPSDPDDYYDATLAGFSPIEGEVGGAPGSRLIATFTPWEEAQHRYPDGFELWELAVGGFRIVDVTRTIERTFPTIADAADAFRTLALRFGVAPERRDGLWPDAG